MVIGILKCAPGYAQKLRATDFLKVKSESPRETPVRESLDFELVLKETMAEYSLTLESFGPRAKNNARVQIVRQTHPSDRIELLLHHVITRLGRLEVTDEFVPGLKFQGLLAFESEIDLRVRLAVAAERLARELPDLELFLSPLRDDPAPYSSANVNALLKDFIRQNITDPHRVATCVKNLSTIRTYFLRHLSPREETLFDWAIFAPRVGQLFTEKAERIEAIWRELDAEPDLNWASIHDQIREKFIAAAQRRPKDLIGGKLDLRPGRGWL